MSEAKEQRLLLELVGDTRAPIELPRQGVMTIGSADSADVVVSGQGIADVHCAIGRIKGGGWALKDLGSEYGVLVNGDKVQSRKLEAGDLLLVGSRRIKIVDAEALTSAKPAPVASAQQAAPPSVAAPVQQKPVDAATSKLPQVRGYRVEKPLGRGGMGEVYLAVQESLGRPVALKVLSTKLSADADFVKRFQSEARAAAALNHPNVVTVHDVWEENGRHFLAMEFMDRGNLEQRLTRDGKLPPKDCIDVLHDAAKALVYAELRGIVHRDIKPANLMQNSVGTIKVADLGLAMHLEAEATESDNKKIFGTPHFISPEQARGEKVDIRSDLYSLGATSYRLLCGRTPFEGATTRDILRGHFLEEPKALGELVPGVPADLARIIHRLLQKKPDDRFPSAGVLLQEVERLRSVTLHGAPAVAAPAKKFKLGPWIAVAIVAAIVGGVVYLVRGGSPSAHPTDIDGPGAIATHTPSDPNAGSAAGNGGASGDPVDATQRPPVDDDTALKLRETEAEVAGLKLAKDLLPKERATALLALAETFAGTTKAAQFKEEADQLLLEDLRARTLTTAYDHNVVSFLERLRAAGRNGDAALPLSDALRAMLQIETPPDLGADPAVLAKRTALFGECVRGALDVWQIALTAVNETEARGRFDEVDSALRPWLAAFDLPPLPKELGHEVLPDLVEVDTTRQWIRRKLDGLDSARELFAQKLGDDDALELATALRGAGGFEGALRSLDFSVVEAQLGALDAKLATEQARTFVADLRKGLAHARSALVGLAAEYERGGWRRKTLNDPRSKGRVSRDAVGASAEGITLRVDDASELVPWSAFGGRTTDLHQLFHQRLAREYTRDELLGIETLLRATAVLQAVDETAEMLQPGANAVLSEEELRVVTDAFEAAKPWAQLSGAPGALEREHQAASLLVDALRAASDAGWSRSVAEIERLLGEFRDTLLVRLLSDGRPRR